MKSYFITEQAFVDASISARRKPLRILWFFLFALPPLVFLQHGFVAQGFLEVGLLYCISLAAYFLFPRFLDWLSRSTYRKNPLLQKEQRFELREGRLNMESENGSSSYALNELVRIEFLEELVLVWPMTTLFHMLPRESLTPEELEELELAAKSLQNPSAAASGK